ncbi:MAG: transcriptional repressor [Acidobacteria bacterium]|nr:transcriptional repressor [Acidobacteriota bacterium]MBI3655480.1 transcriptional repressor [Acidobacteriota bacterium]
MINAAITLLRKKGLKPTQQRLAIYQALMTSRDHPHAQKIYRKVRKKHVTISLNTVYNTLEAFKRAGLIGSVKVLHDESARYDPTVDPHNHIVCMKCKKVTDLFEKKLLRIPTPSEIGGEFKIMGYRVEFFGYCRVCAGASP